MSKNEVINYIWSHTDKDLFKLGCYFIIPFEVKESNIYYKQLSRKYLIKVQKGKRYLSIEELNNINDWIINKFNLVDEINYTIR